MRKNFLIKNPELFQGERYLKNIKDYFEGWYFKNSNGYDNISFIPGISINKGIKKVFIQVITSNESYYFNYDIDDFEYSYKPFYIKIGNNYFSLDNIHIDIVDRDNNIYIKGDIGYCECININTSRLSPNIMGIFSYVPFMECNHAIINMRNRTNGIININDREINFDDGIGYIEKDYGYSFPKKYIWIQGNDFFKQDAAFMISIADIPFKLFHFRGFICSLIVDGCEYRFASYNNSKILKYYVDDKKINIILKKGKYRLKVYSKYGDGLKLIAPVKGDMSKEIIESISEEIYVVLEKNGKVIFDDVSTNCGLEIVKK